MITGVSHSAWTGDPDAHRTKTSTATATLKGRLLLTKTFSMGFMTASSFRAAIDRVCNKLIASIN